MRKYVFEEIYEELQMQIRNGTYQSGMPLPSESELGTHYECGRETIRRSLRLLEKDGLIIRKRARWRMLPNDKFLLCQFAN
ncbi:MAG: winged helix-turn-helix domain-containing protein [Weissella confusa]